MNVCRSIAKGNSASVTAPTQEELGGITYAFLPEFSYTISKYVTLAQLPCIIVIQSLRSAANRAARIPMLR